MYVCVYAVAQYYSERSKNANYYSNQSMSHLISTRSTPDLNDSFFDKIFNQSAHAHTHVEYDEDEDNDNEICSRSKNVSDM